MVQPLISRTGDIGAPAIRSWEDGIGLLAGDLGLSRFEDVLADAWPRCFSGDEGAFRVMTAFHRTVVDAAEEFGAGVALVDVGPNLGAINRAALISASHFVVPLGPDLFSRQGLRNLGPTIGKWSEDWQTMCAMMPIGALSTEDLPAGTIEPIGYIFMRHSISCDTPSAETVRYRPTAAGCSRCRASTARRSSVRRPGR